MRSKVIFSLSTPYRESMKIRAAEFGDADAQPCCAIVGSMRGNEVQQTFIAANLVGRLRELEREGLLNSEKRILVIPAANAFSMNIHKRFWPVDNTDVNRMFPGYDKGETTQRIAAGIFEAVSSYDYGVQLASFYLRGAFLPHVRVTDEGDLSRESLEMAALFGMPCTLLHKPSTFDTTTLNYNWQVWNTHAFSLFTKATGSIDEASARQAEDGIVRFLTHVGAVREEALSTFAETETGEPARIEESSLSNVRSERAGCSSRLLGLGNASCEVRSLPKCATRSTEACATRCARRSTGACFSAARHRWRTSTRSRSRSHRNSASGRAEVCGAEALGEAA